MMLAIREKLKPLTENGISGARKLGTDLTMTDSGEFLEKINFRDLPDNTFVMGEQEGMFQTCDLDQTLCFTVCGSGKTGKTNFLKYTALQMKKKGAEVYVFDGCLKEMVTGCFVSLAAGNRESTLEELLMNREFLIMK